MKYNYKRNYLWNLSVKLELWTDSPHLRLGREIVND